MEFHRTTIDINLCFQAFQIYLRKNDDVREHLSRIALDNEENKPGGVYVPLFDRDFPVTFKIRSSFFLNDQTQIQVVQVLWNST